MTYTAIAFAWSVGTDRIRSHVLLTVIFLAFRISNNVNLSLLHNGADTSGHLNINFHQYPFNKCLLMELME